MLTLAPRLVTKQCGSKSKGSAQPHVAALIMHPSLVFVSAVPGYAHQLQLHRGFIHSYSLRNASGCAACTQLLRLYHRPARMGRCLHLLCTGTASDTAM